MDYLYGDKRSKRTILFINKVLELCKKYQRSISHEDSHGAFLICEYNTSDKEWFQDATEIEYIEEGGGYENN